MNSVLDKYMSKGSASKDSKGSILLNMKTCIGCTACASVCPHGNFVMEVVDIDGEKTIKATVKDEYLCTLCNQCTVVCPTASITIAKI